MKKIGTYKIETSFYIPDRGIITVCQQIEGIVRIGSITNIEFEGKIIAAKSPHPFLVSSYEDVQTFRNRSTIHNLIGETNFSRVKSYIERII